MRQTDDVPRFTPPTPRSRRLGRELRALRTGAKLTLEQVGERLQSSPSRISRVESGEIKARPGDVMELLDLYGVDRAGEQGDALLELARQLKVAGWWQRMETLSQRYLTFIGFEAEANTLRNFEPVLVPGLLQTEEYAAAVVAVGRETEHDAIDELVSARLKRQEVLSADRPIRLHAILSEAVLLADVGGADVMHAQCEHLVRMSRRANVTLQVLPFAAGAHLATHGGFAVLGFEQDDPDLGYIETLAGELFLESAKEIDRLNIAFDNLRMLSLSPAESARRLQERRSHG